MTDDRCKHGMLEGTCGMCAGLVKTAGELHYLWLDFCERSYDLNPNSKSQQEWFKNNKCVLIQLFFEKWGQMPPFPMFPEK